MKGKKSSALESGLSCIAWYPQCEFNLQSRASLTSLYCWMEYELSCDHPISIMYASCVQALHWGFMPKLNLCIMSTFLPINHHWWWEDGDALKYWFWYGQLKSLCKKAADFSRKLAACSMCRGWHHKLVIRVSFGRCEWITTGGRPASP